MCITRRMVAAIFDENSSYKSAIDKIVESVNKYDENPRSVAEKILSQAKDVQEEYEYATYFLSVWGVSEEQEKEIISLLRQDYQLFYSLNKMG